MDVAVYDWATSEMGPVGPTSEKLASLMKNRVILIAKHCKKEKEMRRTQYRFFFSLLRGWSSSSSRHGHRNSKHKGKKNQNLAEKITSVLRLDF